ncbi:hypothetical protein ACFY5C_39910 [Streptomyces sp. NPDC012935]|uniref:hypothetical protein n=1 Tax=Streptomyces sp. NPDC012935 TaxID=3364857 RepID=UPI003688EE55
MEAFLTGLVRLSDAMMIVRLVEQLRVTALHETAERLIDLSAQHLPFHSLDYLLWLFYKEDWRPHVLLTAVARHRAPGEVCELLRQMLERQLPEAEALHSLFRELRSDDDNAELEQMLEEADAG